MALSSMLRSRVRFPQPSHGTAGLGWDTVSAFTVGSLYFLGGTGNADTFGPIRSSST